MDLCYNCGNELNSQNRTREHIPAQNMFVGYPDEYKVNRITVPACYSCNNLYSKVDQEIRDAIGIMNEDNMQQHELTRKSVKSIMRRGNWKDRVFSIDGRIISVSFDYSVFREIHIKNFRALFYRKYGYPVPDNFRIEIIAEGDEDDHRLMEIGQLFYNYLVEDNSWGISGHEDIFKYKIKSLTPLSGMDSILRDSPNLDDSLGVVGVLVYHQAISPIIIAIKDEFFDSLKLVN